VVNMLAIDGNNMPYQHQTFIGHLPTQAISESRRVVATALALGSVSVPVWPMRGAPGLVLVVDAGERRKALPTP
jgi:hypothetical protein